MAHVSGFTNLIFPWCQWEEKKSMDMDKFIIPFLIIALVSASACSDDEPQFPTNATTVNMMNSDNGQTTIGGSDVYINSANNFTTNDCGIVTLGSKGGFGMNPNLSQIAQDVAVVPGNYYQIILASDVVTVAGERAFPINSNFYTAYVDSWIYGSDNKIIGAKVSYAESFPSTDRLPDWDATIDVALETNGNDESATYSFAAGTQIDAEYSVYNIENSNLSDYLEVEIQGNQVKFNNSAWVGGKAKVVVLVRYEGVYTRVSLIVAQK